MQVIAQKCIEIYRNYKKGSMCDGSFFIHGIVFAALLTTMKRVLLFIFLVWFSNVHLWSQEMEQYHWRDVRSTRDSILRELRDTRSALRREVRDVRDSVRMEIYTTIDSIPHEIRIGWGDQLFESLMWRESGYVVGLPSYRGVYNERYRYTQHIFAEYLYNASYWYSFGVIIDYSGVVWDEVERDGDGLELSRIRNQSFHNIVVMPEVRFSYFHSKYASLYSPIGLGLNINTGSEVDYKGRTTALSPVVNISLLGVCIGSHRWYGAIEFGGMFSLMNSNEVYMLGSRLLTVSVGMRM